MGIKETADHFIWSCEPSFEKHIAPRILKTTDWLIEHRMFFWVKGAENLQQIMDTSTSIVFVSTHTGMKDLGIVEAAYLEMAKLGQEYIGHWSIPHAQSYEAEIMPYHTWVKIMRERGYTMTGVTHGYRGRRVNSPKDGSDSQPSSFQAFRDIFKPHSRMFIFIEGHRSNNPHFAVNPAEDIAGFLLLMAQKKQQPLSIVPTAIIPHCLGGNICFGEPRDIAFLKEKVTQFIDQYQHQLPQTQYSMITLLSQVAMLDLCEQLLPPEMHGMYTRSHPYFLEVMTGQIKLGLVTQGNKEVVTPLRKTLDSLGNTIWQPLSD